jgi:hypothetical protein
MESEVFTEWEWERWGKVVLSLSVVSSDALFPLCLVINEGDVFERVKTQLRLLEY